MSAKLKEKYEALPTAELAQILAIKVMNRVLMSWTNEPSLARKIWEGVKTDPQSVEKYKEADAEIEYLKALIDSRPDKPIPPAPPEPIPGLSIVKLVSYDEASKLEEGGTEQHEKVLEKYIVDNNIRKIGIWHQREGCPVFSDGKTMTFGLRAWGGFLADIWSEIDGKKYSYMDFYLWGEGE